MAVLNFQYYLTNLIVAFQFLTQSQFIQRQRLTLHYPNDDKAAANTGFCASWADGITMSICNSIWLLSGLNKHRRTFIH